MNRIPSSTSMRRSAITASVSIALVLAGGVLLPATASATEGATATSTCTTSWPADVKGRPVSIKAGLPEGAWIWRDANGFHLRVTHAGKTRSVFRGFITSTSKVYGIGVRVEGPDVVARTADMKTVGFRFTNYGGIDGIDFKVAGCTPTLRIAVAADGERLSPSQVRLGADASPATANPVVLKRT